MFAQTKVSFGIAKLASVLLTGVFFSAPAFAESTDSAQAARCMLCSSAKCSSTSLESISGNISKARDSSASSPDPVAVVQQMILGTTAASGSHVANVATRSNDSDREGSWDPMLIARKMILGESR